MMSNITSTMSMGGRGSPTLGDLQAFVASLQGQSPDLRITIKSHDDQLDGSSWSMTASPVPAQPVQAPHWGHKPGCRCPDGSPLPPNRRGMTTPSGLDLTEGGTR